ncbi:MAG: biopolymer transporter ExbD [Pseudomonadota bacterium]
MSLRPKDRRARLSMTSLIDVIFLLLLFFMLSSTFSKFAEVELTAGSSGATITATDAKPLFLRLLAQEVSMNGVVVPIETLRRRLEPEARPALILISVTENTTAQTLTDVLTTLRDVPDVSLVVLGSS